MKRAARRNFWPFDSDDDEDQSQEFNIPTPISLPSDEESMPLSQHRVCQRCEAGEAEEDVDKDSQQEDDAEDDDEDEDDGNLECSDTASIPQLVYSDPEDDDGEEQHPACKTKPDVFYSGAEELSAKFKEMSKQMKAMLAQQRRLSERLSVPSDCLSPPRKALKLNLKENFDWPRKEAIVVPESDGADEDHESMSVQGSSQTSRKKFQPLWKIIGSKSLIEQTAEEIQQ
jgi:hypothetical protein